MKKYITIDQGAKLTGRGKATIKTKINRETLRSYVWDSDKQKYVYHPPDHIKKTAKVFVEESELLEAMSRPAGRPPKKQG